MKAFGMSWAGGALLGCSLLATSAIAGDRTANLVVKDANGQSLTNVGVYYTSDGAASKANFAGETAMLSNLGDKVVIEIESNVLGNHRGEFRLAEDADVTAAIDGAGNIVFKVDQLGNAQDAAPRALVWGMGGQAAVGVNGSNSCSTASAIAGEGNFPLNTVGATTDGVAHPPCLSFGQDNLLNDIWYSWTADCDGNVTIDTCGANWDSKVAVYNSGVACPPGTVDLLVCNDDFCSLQSSVTLAVTNGTTYLIRVGSFSAAATGSGTLNIACIGGGGGGDCTAGVGCQLPDQAGHGSGGTLAATSDANPNAGFAVSDTFSPTANGLITTVCWWGVYINFAAGVVDCSPGPGDNFTITYFTDGGGTPGAVHAGPFPVILTVKAPTGAILAGIAFEYVFEAIHPPVGVTAGECYWIRVQNNTVSGDCFWLWSTAPPGDSVADQNGAFQDYDLAFCLDIATTSDGCGVPPPPSNDLCEDAIDIPALPASINGTTAFATTDFGAPTCVTSVSGPGVWYTVTGTGNTITASTCANPAYDTKLNVYCGGCDDFTCVTGNDDFCAFQSEVSWCSQSGVEYLILVQGFSPADSGPFTLDVTDNGVACAGAVNCLPAGACCIGVAQDICVVVTADDCLAQGGVYIGDGTVCSGYVGSDCANAFFDISGMAPNLGLGDDNGVVLPLGFTFDFFGSAKATVGVASNGYLTFGATLGDFTNDPIPTAATPNDIICPMWDDFSPNEGGSVHAMTMGVAPNRTFIAQWNNVPQFGQGDSNTFQAILFEIDDSIEFRYGTFSGNVTPTVGVENATGTDGLSLGLPSPGDCLRVSVVTPPCPPVECFLVFGTGAGTQPFNSGGHTWQTQLSGVYNFEATLMDDLPVMQIPPYTSGNGNGAPFGIRRLPRGWMQNVPIDYFSVQVLMWNPEVFPANPEQHSHVMNVVVWASGFVETELTGTVDNIDIFSETFWTSEGTHYLRFPFIIHGF